MQSSLRLEACIADMETILQLTKDMLPYYHLPTKPVKRALLNAKASLKRAEAREALELAKLVKEV